MAFNLFKKVFDKKIASNTLAGKFAFVSYDEADAAFVQELSGYLISQELPALIDKYVENSYKIVDYERKIERCNVFLLIMSGYSRRSEQVTKEFEIAIKHKKLIIPLSLNAELFVEFENVQCGDANKLYGLSIELAERLRALLTPDQIPSKLMQKRRIEYVVILLFEKLFSSKPIYDGKKLLVDHSKILNDNIDADELDWMDFFVTLEGVLPSENYCQANYNSNNFPTLNHLVDYFFDKLNWDDIKNIELTGLQTPFLTGPQNAPFLTSHASPKNIQFNR